MVKLADFGVAMKLNEANTDDQIVVGSPYWIAPEVIEMSTPTAACDIWSVGCIVIELLTGKPPYFDLQPMNALFRIVQDDYPPLPEGISQALRDFLFNCFQKEPIMRSSAAKLLEHPWLQISSASKIDQQQASLLNASKSSSSREQSNEATDSIMNAIKLHRKETQQNAEFTEAKLSNKPDLSIDASFDSKDIKNLAPITPLLTSGPKSSVGGTGKQFFDTDTSLELSAISSGDKKRMNRVVSVDSLVKKGLIQPSPTDSGIKSPFFSDAQIISPKRDLTASNKETPVKQVSTLSPMKTNVSSKTPIPSPLRVNTSLPFSKPKTESDPFDDEENWDAAFVDDNYSSESDEDKVVKKDVGIAIGVKENIDSPIRKSPTKLSLNPIQGSVRSMASSSSLSLKRTSSILSPSTNPNPLLSKFQEQPEEETYDDLMADDDDEDKDEEEDFVESIKVDFKKDNNQLSKIQNKSVSFIARKSLSSMNNNSEDFDDLEFEESANLGSSSSTNFANKLRMKLNQTTKEVIEDEIDGFIHYQFDEKDFKQNEQRDIDLRRSKEAVDLMAKVRPYMTEAEVIKFSEQIINIFEQFPEQRDLLITNQGVMPIMDMFESQAGLYTTSYAQLESESFPGYAYYVLKIANKIIEKSVRAQEQLSLVGVIPTVMILLEKSCNNYQSPGLRSQSNYSSAFIITQPSQLRLDTNSLDDFDLDEISDENDGKESSNLSKTPKTSQYQSVFLKNEIDKLTIEAAKFIYQIAKSSSLTLQMLIGAGGLSVLTTMVSFGSKMNRPHYLANTAASGSSSEHVFKLNRGSFTEPLTNSPKTSEISLLDRAPSLDLSISDEFFKNTSYESNCMEIFKMGIDCITQVFAVQSSRTRDFCRLFVKLGLLPHLSISFEYLMKKYRDMMSETSVEHVTRKLTRSISEGKKHTLHHSYSCSYIPSKKIELNDANLISSEMQMTLDNSPERNYSTLIANLFLKFSRSDSTVAETMSNSEKGVILAIFSVLKSPELKHDNLLNHLSPSSGLNNSPHTNSPSSTNSHHNHSKSQMPLKKSRSGLLASYLEIIELLLKCLKNLSMEPNTLDELERAGAMDILVPLLFGPISEQCKVYILPCIFNMCRINRKRQEQAASLGIVPYLKKVITEGSHLRQFALPIIFDLAHASNATRAILWKNDCIVFFLDLLKENYWQTFAFNSLAQWFSHDLTNVSRVLVQPNNISKLIGKFHNQLIIIYIFSFDFVFLL